ncbi:hypothetical protein BC835DRAFT_517718 [Cytidiella melzeri]|nr:hypothetical protein BC835DRAFT_517718 [Cytidiella melzeri]
MVADLFVNNMSCTSSTMIVYPQSSTGALTRSPVNEPPRSGVVRRGGLRSPRRNGRVCTSLSLQSVTATECRIQPVSAGSYCPEPPLPLQRPHLVRHRSVSCSGLDWFKGELEWNTVESGPCLSRSGSYKTSSAQDPVFDIRHSCVKTNSPTIVQQQQSYDITPLVAEVFFCEEHDNSVVTPSPPTANDESAQLPHINSYRTSDQSKAQVASRLSIQIPSRDFHL